MKKIAVYGGTFNPIHNGHLVALQQVVDSGYFDEVHVMPSANPPFKLKTSIDGAHRLAMTKIAIEDLEQVKLNLTEYESEDVSYTYHTLNKLKELHPDHVYYWVVGFDNLEIIETWKDGDKLLKEYDFAVVNRGGFDSLEASRLLGNLTKRYGTSFYEIKMPNIEISSTDIRERVMSGKSLAGYLPESVIDYIELKGLYGEQTMKDFKDTRKYLLKKVKKKLTDKRFDHCLRVEQTAVRLARQYGGDVEKVALAAILHDNAKNYSDDKKYKLVKKYKVELSKAEEENIDLVHAKLGSVIAKERYGIKDKEVLNAIKYHTTGRPGMSLTEKIIYIADFIEPGRKEFPGLIKVREIVDKDLDRALIKILMLTINHVVDRGRVIDPVTEETYEFYYKKYANKH